MSFRGENALNLELLEGQRDLKMMKSMVEWWTNFAIHHNPTPVDNAWPKYQKGVQKYVRLSDSMIIKENDPERDHRLEFWKGIFKDL